MYFVACHGSRFSTLVLLSGCDLLLVIGLIAAVRAFTVLIVRIINAYIM